MRLPRDTLAQVFRLYLADPDSVAAPVQDMRVHHPGPDVLVPKMLPEDWHTVIALDTGSRSS
jgi:hypothetical protein